MKIDKLNKLWMHSFITTLIFDVIGFLFNFTDFNKRWIVFIGGVILISWLIQVVSLILIKRELSKS